MNITITSMKLFTCGFIHLEVEDYLHQDQSLKKKPKFYPKNFLMKNKGFKASKSWLYRWKTFYGIRQLNANGEKSSEEEVEAALYCEELADTIFDHGYCTG